MEVIKFPNREKWAEISRRPSKDSTALFAAVQEILDKVKAEGDAALRYFCEKFDGFAPENLFVSEQEISQAENEISSELREAIISAKENIEKFHLSQRADLQKVTTTDGVVCWQKQLPIERVGLYVPGGLAPLFSTVLMLATPAKIAGCGEIVLCSPADKSGKIHPAILFAARVCGVDKIVKIGGAQAIAAMAFGTESVNKVYKIFGPGNQYVTAAKQLVSLRDVAIDMPAGPSEVEILADENAQAEFVAADMLSQAEHGADSQSVLVTDSLSLAEKVLAEVEKQKNALGRKDFVDKSLNHSKIIVFENLNQAIDFTNEYAPEHLIIQTNNYTELAEKVVNAGSVFLGEFTPESAGDYASGTNHTLPTSGFAKMYNGVNLDSFMRKITFQEISQEGLKNLGKTIEIMAENEGLGAHKAAVSVRLSK